MDMNQPLCRYRRTADSLGVQMVRDIAGSPQYELGPDLQAIEHGELDVSFPCY